VSGWPAVFLFLFGVILILVEAFMPGFGIFGLGGLVAVAASIVLSAATAVEGLRILIYSFFFPQYSVILPSAIFTAVACSGALFCWNRPPAREVTVQA
jgi:membrane-bound ClpP family serine protease